MTKKKAKTKLTSDELRLKLAKRASNAMRTYNADKTLRRQALALEQPKKPHAQIKREVDEILAGKHDGTSGAGSLPKSLRFRVDVENQPRRIFNSAEEALSHGMRRVYLHWPKTSEMLERLKRGEPAAWAYGFSSVEIAPL
jgi:hypothetical protein